jgi:hypothetical protein
MSAIIGDCKMKYTLWFYQLNSDSEYYKAYDVFTGTRYECYKLRATKSFRHQYKVLKATW